MAMPDYTVSGTGRVTVFLLHGIYGSKDYWRPQTERLVARGYRVVAWDAPGYGLSPLPDPFTLDVVAEAGAELIRALGSGRNVVHGHSMGGQIAGAAGGGRGGPGRASRRDEARGRHDRGL